MRKFASIVALAALLLAGCGGGESKFTSPDTNPGTDPGTPSAPAVATLNIIASTPTLASSGATPVEISAYARDANNAFVANQQILFTATSGGLQITQGTTDANGLAKAVLTTAGDPTSRTITVTATAGNVSASVDIAVAGSQLSIQGPNASVVGQTNSYTVRLIDSDAKGIPNQTVTISSGKGNSLSATSLTTDASGGATFTMTVANPGNDTLTASAMGITSTLDVAVNSDAFTFTAPAPNTEVALGATQTITARWLQGGTPVVGQPIEFASTRGTLSASTVITDGTGSASVTISSSNSGGAIVTASAASGPTAQLAIEFVATTAAAVELQPSVFTLAPGEQSTLTATVRDANGNLVKNKMVSFSLEDITGGSLTTASAITDSQGRAQSSYIAGTSTSAKDGVKITASVAGAQPDEVHLTVAQRQVFITLGTGNEMEEPNQTQYKIPYVVQITDANGNGVAGVPLSLSALSVTYRKGLRTNTVPVGTQVNATCADEDANRNGLLDPGEDFNSSGRIEAGNIVTVTPRNAVTDQNGFAFLEVVYPQEYAYYLTVNLEARAAVQGTEFVRSSVFLLPGTKTDFDGNQAPPGPVSPFGVSTDCANPN
ncbi:MAG: Ig-like domain-containing protein [Steroidobacteraceae bacterium]|nr:Ig-like domain-containing protein [Steroidobacteraceae bacterium]